MGKPRPIGSILESTFKGLEIDFQLKAYSLWGAWREIVGEPVALQAQPHSIRNRILFVDVSHSTWMQQLQFLKPKLLQQLNGFLGEPMLQDIRFHLGKIAPKPASPSKADLWQNEKLDEATARRIEAFLQEIRDVEVQKTLREVLIKGAKLEQHRKKLK